MEFNIGFGDNRIKIEADNAVEALIKLIELSKIADGVEFEIEMDENTRL